MDRTDFAKGMEDLSEFYSRTVSPGATEVWWKKIRWLDRRDFYAAIEDITANERQMPTPGIFLKYSDEARTRRSAQEKLRDRSVAREAFDPGSQSKEIAKDSCEGLDIIMKLKSPRERQEFLISWSQGMHKKYPRAGFDELEVQARRELLKIERVEVEEKISA